MSGRERAARPRTWVWALVCLSSVVTLAVFGPVSETGAQAEAPLTVTVSEPGPYANGQFVTVDVAVNGGAQAASATAFICRAGKAYDSNMALSANAGDCPSVAISAAQGESSRFGLPTYAGGSKARGLVTMGIGTASWFSTADNSPLKLTCGPSDPCMLVVKVDTVDGGSLYDASTSLTFGEPDLFAGCAGGATDAPTSAGADRMLTLWEDWTLGECQAGTDKASTIPPGPGEGDGVAAFAAGQADIAYTAAGYDAPGFGVPEKRPAVATPLALNAVVLAAAGGSFPTGDPSWPEGLKRPYEEVRLTRDEVATLLGQGQFDLQGAHGPALLERNPELGRVYNTSTTATAPLALSSTSALSLVMTQYADTLAPDAWKGNAAAGGAPRGVDANLGLAEVSFGLSGALKLVADSSLIDQAVYRFEQGFSALEPGPQWVLTDLATATRLGMTPVSIENAAGQFVRPTPASLAAAVPTMKPQPDGTLAPDVTTTAAGAYPLTIVEYALSPKGALADAACAPRVTSQGLLEGWLAHITGPGQSALAPKGFVPLPEGLATEAKDSLGAVGADPSPCEPPPTTPPGTTPGPGPGNPPGTTQPTTPFGPLSPSGAEGGAGSGGGAGAGEGAGTAPGEGEAQEPTAADRKEAADAAADAEIDSPALLGTKAVSAVGPPLSVLLVVLVTSMAAFLTSGRPLPASVTTAGRTARGAVGATGRGARRAVGAVGGGVRSAGRAVRPSALRGRGT